jgi:hypothetical protein
MLAGVSISGAVTVTAPSGWTLVRTMTYTNGSGDEHSGSTTLAIMKRTAGSSESASWTGSHTSTGRPKITQCVAYRNCDTASNQFIAENGTTGTNVNMTTPTITNTDSRAWRVAFFAPETSNGCSVSLSGNSERADDSTSASGIEDVNLSVYDSNGNVSTGSHTLTAKASDSVYSTCQWIGLLKPLSSGPGAGANETERQDATAGSSTDYITLAAYDSNAAAATGTTNVYGTFTPGSGSSVLSSCAWLGFLIPSAPTTAGEAGCTAVDYLDISNVSQEVMTRAGNRVTVQASFLGSTAGVPHVKLYSYVGNELVSTQIAEGASFNTSTWTKAVASFVIPDGITRLKMGVSAMDRAVNDYVLFDRCSVALGGDTTYRPGTGKSAHPIFSAPIIEYAEDLGSGYGSWKPLAGTPSALMKYDNLTGLVTFVEQTVVPLSSRKYRAKTISWGLAGDSFISGFGPESPEVTLVAQDWWLKDLSSPNSSLKLKVKAEPLAVNTNDTSAVFQPLGADRPFVVSEGYKGDTLDLTLILERADYLQLRDMFNSTRTLFLQSNLDNAWWVRPYGDIGSATQLTGKMHTKPLRFVKVSFVEVDPEV